MSLEQKLSAFQIFEEQRSATSRGDDQDEPLDDRLEQSVELGFLAKTEGQLIEESEGLRSCRIDRLPGLEHGRGGIDHRVDVETRVVGSDERAVIRADTGVELGLGDRGLYLDRR